MGYYKHFVEFSGDQQTFSQAKHWCHKEFGKEGSLDKLRKWVECEAYNPHYCSGFGFRNEIDAMAFKLRWT